MAKNRTVHTYRCCKKQKLEVKPDQFVIRSLSKKLPFWKDKSQQRMSSKSMRVCCSHDELEDLMKRGRTIAPTHHAYYSSDTGNEFLITDRIIVTFKDELESLVVDKFAGNYGLVLKNKYSNREYLFQLTDHTGKNPVKLVVELMEENKLVEMADHDLNYRMNLSQSLIPNDPHYKQQWHLHTQLQDPDFDQLATTHCDHAWERLGNYGNSSVVIAVTDDGCRLDHADFIKEDKEKFAGWGYMDGERLVNNLDADGLQAAMYIPGSNHGTSCAGVIAGEVDGELTVGAAPDCRLFPIKWQSDGPRLFISDSKFLTVLNHLADKVDVVSSSWSVVPRSLWSSIVRNRIIELTQQGGRRGKGILFLFAAGNDNCPINHTASIDVPYTHGWKVRDDDYVWEGPKMAKHFENNLVDVPGVMHVAALSSIAKRSHYSNYGDGIDLCAPSSNSHAYYRMQVRGLSITTTTGNPSGVTPYFGGTSSATPLVAGIAALVISANPQLNAIEVVRILKRTASKELNMEGYPKTPPANYDETPTWDVSPIAPFDKGDFQENGLAEGTWSPWFGHGVVDASRAVAEALRPLSVEDVETTDFISSPDRAIPDNRESGITDIINVPNDEEIKDLKVNVDIKHPYIGDLKVTLIAPDGNSVVLHNKTGKNKHNLIRTYEVSKPRDLEKFLGMNAKGDWTLQVQDFWPSDKGRLKSWGLAFTFFAEPIDESLVAEDRKVADIPDDDPNGIVCELEIVQSKPIENILIEINITHPFIYDLSVTLIAPDDDEIVLQQSRDEFGANIKRIWDSKEFLPLQQLRGKDSDGVWKLKVADELGQDIGTLNWWRIEIF